MSLSDVWSVHDRSRVDAATLRRRTWCVVACGCMGIWERQLLGEDWWHLVRIERTHEAEEDSHVSTCSQEIGAYGMVRYAGRSRKDRKTFANINGFGWKSFHRRTKAGTRERSGTQPRRNLRKFRSTCSKICGFMNKPGICLRRWDYFIGSDGVYMHPVLPPLPEFSDS